MLQSSDARRTPASADRARLRFQLAVCRRRCSRVSAAPLLWQDEAETAMLRPQRARVSACRRSTSAATSSTARRSAARARPQRDARRLPRIAVGPVLLRRARGRVVGSRRRSRRAHAGGCALPFALAGWLGVLLLGARAARACGPRRRAAARVVLARASASASRSRCRSSSICARSATTRSSCSRSARVAQLEVRRHAARRPAAAAPHAAARARAVRCSFNLFYPAFARRGRAAARRARAAALARARSAARARASSSRAAPRPTRSRALAALPLVAFFRLPAQSRSFFETFERSAPRVRAAARASRPSICVRFELLRPAALRRGRARVARAGARRAEPRRGAARRARGLLTSCSRSR